MTDRADFSCRRFEEGLEAYLDGALDAEATALFDAHLDNCAGCTAELEAARRLLGTLRGLPSLEAPAPAVAAVLATARAEAGARSERARSWWPAVLSPRPALAALGVALLATIAILATFGPERRAPEPPAPDAAAVARATLETKLALAHFARANRRVGRGVSEDLLRDRLVRPVVDGFRAPAHSAPAEDTSASERG